MIGPLSSEQEQLLRDLFAGLEVDVDLRTLNEELDGYILFGSGIVIRGEALRTHQQLVYDLTSSAFADGGFQAEEVQRILHRACAVALEAGQEAAVEKVNHQLAARPQTWTIVGELGGNTPERNFKIGMCDVFHDLGDFDESFGVKGMTPPFIRTSVAARDLGSARIVATERIEEAEAILALMDLERRPPVRELWHSREGESTLGMSGGRTKRFHVATRMNGPEHPDLPALTPEFQALSDAAANPHERRRDWPRRVLGAARWFRRTLDTTWHAESLVAAMAAMECIFVEGRRIRAKGKTIAERMTDRWLLRGFNREEQCVWINDMYQHRNDIVHSGASVQEDLDIERFVDLSKIAMRWCIWHLSPFHRIPNKPCLTFDEVFSSEAHPDSLLALHSELEEE